VSPIVLALNSGSSSLKFGLYRVEPSGLEVLHSGETELKSIDDTQNALIGIAELLTKARMPAPAAIGHRVVHGGPNLRDHCLINDPVLGQLEAATAFAPLHIPPALSVIRFARKHFGDLPNVACFDTAFHAGMPEVAQTLPVDKALRSNGIQRYGFHGLSCESIVRQLGKDLPDRLIIAHLGNGASITAVKAGRSIDTSMGLTPTGGVIMGTRSGDLDPGLLVYLAREKAFDPAMLEELVDRRSGLLGISGLSGDMRLLHRSSSTNADARLAIRMFCYSVRKQVAGMIAVLDGIDMIVFTGGIGENDPQARLEICAGLSWMGVSLDEASNRSGNNPLNDSTSRCRVLVMASQEDEQIARHTRDLVAKN
jgi:acetate kinase